MPEDKTLRKTVSQLKLKLSCARDEINQLKEEKEKLQIKQQNTIPTQAESFSLDRNKQTNYVDNGRDITLEEVELTCKVLHRLHTMRDVMGVVDQRTGRLLTSELLDDICQISLNK
eukprot:gb/GECH01008862.1/.p1 GENE.gb/GECH01008862.1/~~gb/GECH01008862.1/.p1  ORF type:complete len:116 (+),score=20.59 gb/GECH01008862.1/:1-348(+)